MVDVLEISMDKNFHCPFHPPDNTPSACLLRGDRGNHFVWCAHPNSPTYTLAEVLAARCGAAVEFTEFEGGAATKRKRLMTEATHAIWKVRLLYLAGLIELPYLPPVIYPDGFGEAARRVVEGARYLCQLKACYFGKFEATTFARDFASPWCGLTVDTWRVGLREARQRGLMREKGRSARAILYVPAGVPA
jgi:hypothetical protein